MTNKRKDGQFYDEEMTIAPVRDTDGQIVNFVCIKTDVTKRKEAEQKLQAQLEQIKSMQQTVMQQERLRALGQMASGIAHDIDNALVPASLYAESLLETEPM